VTAREFGVERLKTLPLSLRLVRELHEKLMRGVRGEHATPGEFRRSQNWIGRPGCTLTEASYVPPPSAELMNLLGRWETFLHEQSLPPLVQAALMHYHGPGSKSPTYNNVLSPPINSSCRQTILIF
jgi:Fic family protein